MQDPSKPAVLFDLDGTLVDSLQDIGESMNAVLKANRCPEHPIEAYREFVGDGMDMLVQRALPPGRVLSDNEHIKWVIDMKAEYESRWQNHPYPYNGIPEMLDLLTDSGIAVGILSNKPHAFVTAMVESVFPDTPWGEVRGTQKGLPIKPAADGGIQLLKAWGYTPDQVWYVGDTRTDLLFAQNCGMASIGVTWGFRDRAELETYRADYIVESPADLAQHILTS
jgi:phosphoglycolate phosphatase